MINKMLKHWLCGLIVASVMLYAGCAPREQLTEKPAGASVQSTQAANVASEPIGESQEEPAAPLRAIGDSEIPMLFTIQRGDTTCDIYRVIWNIKDATLSDREFCYSIQYDNYNDYWGLFPLHWIGGSAFIGKAYDVLDQCAEGITYQPVEKVTINYGKCYYKSGSDVMKMEHEDGSVTDVQLPPDVPAETYDRNRLSVEPYYATVDGDTAIVVYMDYKFSKGEGSSFVYCTYPVERPEEAQWHVAAIPAKYGPDAILSKWRGAYADGCLYIGVKSGFVSLDLSNEAFTEIANIEYSRSLYPDGTTVNPHWGHEYPSISASQNDVIIGTFRIYEGNGSERLFIYAFKNNNIVSIVEFTDNVYTFYDPNLNVLNVDNTYADLPLVYIRFAKDD